MMAVTVFLATSFFLKVSYLRGLSLAGFWAVCILLALVLIVGVELKGSKRWIYLGFFYLQPSEMAKIAVIFLVAHFASSYRRVQAYKLWELFPIAGHLLLLFGLVVVEPDLGTAAVCLMIGCAQLAFLRVERSSLYYLFAGSVVSAVIGWTFLLRDYQKLRILNFINPERDPFGSGYNIHQSLIAVGSGGWFGKGWLAGSQTQLEFLPARHTDFVMSVFAEENGFIAVLGILFLFFVLIYASLSLAKKFRDNFLSFLAIGFGALFFLQISINLAMILGWFPVVGIPLPFFTKGGTSLIVYSFAMGCLVAISRELKPISTSALGAGHLYSMDADSR
jgi:rod shape determining protein RodA